MKTYLLYFSKTENSYAFFPMDNEKAKSMLLADDQLIWQCKALTWEEALQQRDNYLGWNS